MQMPDVPVNVPIDDPNADTEWSVSRNASGYSTERMLTRATAGTTSSANMALYPKSLPRRRL